jgi:hypothetical protein
MPKIIDSEEYRKELLHNCFDLFAPVPESSNKRPESMSPA